MMTLRCNASSYLVVIELMMQKTILLLCLSLLLVGCEETLAPPLVSQGMRPLYATQSVGDTVSMAARPYVDLGALLVTDNYVLLVEQNQGVHVVDNTDRNFPIPIAFLQLHGVTQMTSDGDYLYATIGFDMYVLDIGDWQAAFIATILQDVVDPDIAVFTPPQDYRGYFECVDLSQGNVAGWEMAELANPECQTF